MTVEVKGPVKVGSPHFFVALEPTSRPGKDEEMRMKGEFLTAINMLSTEKGVSPDIVVEALESALISAYKRNFNDTSLNITAQIDSVTGEPRVLAEKTVTEDPSEPNEISVERARTISPEAAIGDTVWEDVTPRSFGRIAAQT